MINRRHRNKTFEILIEILKIYVCFRIGKFSFDWAKECKDPRRSVQKMADLVEICACPSSLFYFNFLS
jgi:hypothetical protein